MNNNSPTSTNITAEYELNEHQTELSSWQAIRNFWPFLRNQKKRLFLSLFYLLLNTAASLATPLIIGLATDRYIQQGDEAGLLRSGILVLIVSLISLATGYGQTKLMGTVGQHVLFSLRNAIFNKLQSLPIAFFDVNKAGDLISRINNDTDNLNRFFSQGMMRFIGNAMMMVGTAIFVLTLNVKLGAVALAPAVLLLVFTQLVSSWIKQRNARNLKAVGAMSGEIQESLDNFKVVVAFNRRDYFKNKFAKVNQENYETAISAAYANNILRPIYDLAYHFAQILVLFFGVYLISRGEFTVGLLITYISYLGQFYNPIRQIAQMWSMLQLALASWDRISQILSLSSNLPVIEDAKAASLTEIIAQRRAAQQGDSDDDGEMPIMVFNDVSFAYRPGKDVLHHVNLYLKRGETYALVGPTGGGKTTTASLMARLYDPTSGQVLLDGRDIRTYTEQERSEKVSVILQEPFLFSGTIKDNILYGNDQYLSYSDEQLINLLDQYHFTKLLARFDQGLKTPVTNNGESISLGQKQLIAFMRVVLRDPELLILDEATANVDTVTEQLLDEILQTLPPTTTKVIIAHRLNTIEDADLIFFVNDGVVTPTGSLDKAVSMLMKQKRSS